MTSRQPYDCGGGCRIDWSMDYTVGVAEYRSPLNKEQWWVSVGGANLNAWVVAYGGPLAAGATQLPAFPCEELQFFRPQPPPAGCRYRVCGVTGFAFAQGTASAVLSHGNAIGKATIDLENYEEQASAALEVRGQLAPDEGSSTTKTTGHVEGTHGPASGQATVEHESSHKSVIGDGGSATTAPRLRAPVDDSCMAGTIRLHAMTTVTMQALCAAAWVGDRAEVQVQVTNRYEDLAVHCACDCEPSVGAVPRHEPEPEHAALIERQAKAIDVALARLDQAAAGLLESRFAALEPRPSDAALASALAAVAQAPTPELREAFLAEADALASASARDEAAVARSRELLAAPRLLLAHATVLQLLRDHGGRGFAHAAAPLERILADAERAVARASRLITGKAPDADR